jgi:uncharacterized phage-associated protein
LAPSKEDSEGNQKEENRMAGTERKDFCVECRDMKPYSLRKKSITKTIRDRVYDFIITTAVCEECGSEMSIPGLLDTNAHEIDEQYRTAEGLVTIEDIENLLKVYNIGKAPISLALGFGEVTITRYLAGQVPSKEYSDVIRHALSSPKYMKEMLEKNKEKIADTAYSKGMSAAVSMEKTFSVSDKMLGVISYIFEAEEVTPLMLQKLLYFIQGVYSALFGKYIFKETSEAWQHGPVYRDVYNLFRDFKYNPIDDARFSILRGKADLLNDNERNVTNLVLRTFGMYGGKTLERITHKEEPWVHARKGYGEFETSNEEISNESIKEYFSLVNNKYDISSINGLNAYITAMLKTAA